MKYAVFVLLICLLSGLHAQPHKRGMAYGYHSPEDLQVLSPNIAWWYNWAVAPEASVASVYQNYGFEFVPMTWNGSFNETQLRTYLTGHPEVKYLLAFNEPNFIDQANMTPAAAVAQWPRLEAIAHDFDLEIVAPAVNYCGNCVSANGVTYNDPVKYLDDFFALCPTCQVDHIAIHCYMNTVSALQWYVGLFKKYGKPLWLTEFAGWEQNGNITNVTGQINFMIGAVDMLEADTSVFRYAWFIGRGSGSATYPYIDLLGANGTLTALGNVYKNMPIHDKNRVVDIPVTLEAEAYNTMSGILLEKTSDQTGFANVGYIDAGDWLEYKVNVPQTGTYPVKFRTAATKASTLAVQVDGSTLLTQNFTNTGGWQSWQTFSGTLFLNAGIHTLRLKAITDGFNLNWVQIGTVPTAADPETAAVLRAFPNPAGGVFTIEAPEAATMIEVLTLTGQQVVTAPFTGTLDLRGQAAGIYLLRALDGEGKALGIIRLSVIW